MLNLGLKNSPTKSFIFGLFRFTGDGGSKQ